MDERSAVTIMKVVCAYRLSPGRCYFLDLSGSTGRACFDDFGVVPDAAVVGFKIVPGRYSILSAAINSRHWVLRCNTPRSPSFAIAVSTVNTWRVAKGVPSLPNDVVSLCLLPPVLVRWIQRRERGVSSSRQRPSRSTSRVLFRWRCVCVRETQCSAYFPWHVLRHRGVLNFLQLLWTAG